MTGQLNLLHHARSTDPATSKAAAAGLNLNKRCAEVLAAIVGVSYAPFTDGDLAVWCKEDRGIVARRRGDLEKGVRNKAGELIHPGGLVEPVMVNGEQVQVIGRRKRPEFLWRLTPAGLAEANRLAGRVA